MIYKEKESWQQALSEVITDPVELFKLLDLQANMVTETLMSKQIFNLKVPLSYIARMKKGDPKDPLLLQVLPQILENVPVEGYENDPLAEKEANPVPGLLHKYYGRVLITLTGACAIHCRYCFRRHFPYSENNPGKLGKEIIFDYIRNDMTISEVILSGGDPLIANDANLKHFIQGLESIPHVKLLRIHTRLPVVIPERINPLLLATLGNSRLKTTMVLHINHPQEINDDLCSKLNNLHKQDILLLNQAVLLRGINDDVKILRELSIKLFTRANILPYYLHLLDKVAGSAHFDMPKSEALQIYAELQRTLPGYLLPRLVSEIPGAISKMNVTN